MRSPLIALFVALTLSQPAFSESTAADAMDWKAWRLLPVQDGGRHKPLDSLAWETWRLVSNRTSFTDPETGQRLDATALYLATILDWKGWDAPANAKSAAAGPKPAGGHGGACAAMPMAASIEPDKWDRMPLILVDSLDLRKALGLPEDQKYISPLDLGRAELRDPTSSQPVNFMTWTQRLSLREDTPETPFEQKALDLANRMRTYRDLRAGRRLELAPMPGSKDKQWVTLEFLMLGSFDAASDPQGDLRQLKEKFQKVRAAHLAQSPAVFNEASAAFRDAAGKLGPQLGDYPAPATISLEVAYNHWVPFRFAWVLTLLTSLCLFFHMITRWKPLYWLSLLAYGAAMVAMFTGFGMRTAISGRAPVTNMYESVIYLGLGVAVLGLVLELFSRRCFPLLASSIVTMLALILADNCPAVLDPSLQPLQAVLRDNFWLVTHVMTITLGYAAFALALGIANITLGYYLVGSRDEDLIEALSRVTYHTLQIGFILLAIGTILGGVWADYAWGRFWGWDPKEVWALIALLAYVAVLHARYVGWVRHFGLAVLSVGCFSLVVMAWYGVNFVMGTGLHSYGFTGTAGQGYVAVALAFQFVYVLAAAICNQARQTAPAATA